MSDVLMEIKLENLETGMRGYPVGYCVTSTVDPIKGLFYAGKSVSELISWKPKKVIFLLYHGYEGTKEEIESFSKNLQSRAICSKNTVEFIQKLPRECHPMKLFASSLLMCSGFESVGDYREDCLNLIAKIPQIAATVICCHAGWEKRETNPTLGYMENFSHMLNVPNCNQENLAEVFKLFNILHYDHGGGNLSAFVGKCVASGLEDMYGSISAAMCALEGPRHGRANQDCLNFVQEILGILGPHASMEELEKYIDKKLENHELIYGFGHAVLRVEDPRATLFYELAQKKYAQHPLVKTALMLREAVPKVLKKNPKISNPFPNVDAISGIVLSVAGFPYPEYYTVLFGLARVVGIAIQIVYERCVAREEKGTPIVRPRYIYKPCKEV